MKPNGNFKIEKSVPMPSHRMGAYSHYPLGAMKVGDSFFIPFVGNEDEKFGLRQRAASAASYYGKRHQSKFACRKVDGGVRVWRIA